ncbi:Mce protein [Mycolicibacterium sp.]|jgi:Mce-associated membrane protein|uniref:Mce protein n=1 Tax=Mycolicibacterium sp. TaxID=2320850 RepID=UPI001A28E237|nr:Mce protein [Mycolicibacterium sp.]MBJ7399185.1 Mce protein [Mycolicibacterium sp.]
MEGDAGSGQLTPTPPLTAPDQPESALSSGRFLVRVATALLAASMALVVAGVVAWVSNRHGAVTARDEVVAVDMAKDCIAATQAPDTKAMTESQRKIVACTTENYAPQANLYSSLLAEAYQTVNAKVKIADIRAAAEKHNPDGSIDVLVATRVSMSNVQEKDQELSYRLRVRMAPVDGTYKIDSIEPVGK